MSNRRVKNQKTFKLKSHAAKSLFHCNMTTGMAIKLEQFASCRRNQDSLGPGSGRSIESKWMDASGAKSLRLALNIAKTYVFFFHVDANAKCVKRCLSDWNGSLKWTFSAVVASVPVVIDMCERRWALLNIYVSSSMRLYLEHHYQNISVKVTWSVPRCRFWHNAIASGSETGNFLFLAVPIEIRDWVQFS